MNGEPPDTDEPSEDERIKALLAQFSERERRVLQEQFGVDVPTERLLENVARQFEVVRARLEAIEAKALRRLRDPPPPEPATSRGPPQPHLPSAGGARLPAVYGVDRPSANDSEFSAAPGAGRDPELER